MSKSFLYQIIEVAAKKVAMIGDVEKDEMQGGREIQTAAT